MKIIEVRNVNDAVATALPYLLNEGIREDSRNGKVLVAPGPVVTVYQRPIERVLFSPTRDANPFFHLFESLWMLAGRNDLAFPKLFNQRFGEYSDDGETVWGAYGWRWRSFFGYDQLKVIAEELIKNPNSRRCVLSMWNGYDDSTEGTDFGYEDDLYVATHGGKDVPCNTAAYFDIRGGVLNMTVCNRSNDAIWGAYGANAVHFSILQEYMAAWIGVPVGVYRQFSNNFHAYTDIYDEDKLIQIAKEAADTNYYDDETVKPYSLVYKSGAAAIEEWDKDLALFLDSDKSIMHRVTTDFFKNIAVPMYMAWMDRKAKTGSGLPWINEMPDCDWKLACMQWIIRREAKK